MQPYQKASQVSKEREERFFDIGKKALGTAAGIATSYAGGIAASKVIPFLNQYIPTELMKKGLNHIDKRFGKFINKAEESGYDIDEIKDFLKGKAEEGGQKPAKEEQNIIQQYSPELFEFMKERISSGETPLQAAAAASVQNNFSPAISKMQKDHKTGWGKIAETVFGNQPMAQSQGAQQPQMQGQKQPSESKAALMQMLQKINQTLGA